MLRVLHGSVGVERDGHCLWFRIHRIIQLKPDDSIVLGKGCPKLLLQRLGNLPFTEAQVHRCVASNCDFWAPTKAETREHEDSCHSRYPTRFWCSGCQKTLSATNRSRHQAATKHQPQPLPEPIPDDFDNPDIPHLNFVVWDLAEQASPPPEIPNPDFELDSIVHPSFVASPQYSQCDTSTFKEDWDHFHSPFGPPRFPPDVIPRIKRYRIATGRQNAPSDRWIQQRTEFHKWSTISRLKFYSLITRRLSAEQIKADSDMLRSPRFQPSKIPDNDYYFKLYEKFEVGMPPIYVYISESGVEVPFIWPLDAVALLLQHYSDRASTHYTPEFLREIVTQDWHSWNWYYTWKLSGSPAPSSVHMLMLKFFIDEFKTGLRAKRQNLDVSITLGNFARHWVDDMDMKFSLMTVPPTVTATEITRVILVPAIQLLEQRMLTWQGRGCIGTAEFLGDSVGLGKLAGMKLNVSHYSAVRRSANFQDGYRHFADKQEEGGNRRRFTKAEVEAAPWRVADVTFAKAYGPNGTAKYRLEHGLEDVPSPLWKLRIFQKHFFFRCSPADT